MCLIYLECMPSAASHTSAMQTSVCLKKQASHFLNFRKQLLILQLKQRFISKMKDSFALVDLTFVEVCSLLLPTVILLFDHGLIKLMDSSPKN